MYRRISSFLISLYTCRPIFYLIFNPLPMQIHTTLMFILFSVAGACNRPSSDSGLHTAKVPLQGTWKLLSGTLIEAGDTVATDYTRSEEMIKIINDNHFAFLRHDLSKGQDSLKVFVAGGGRYTLEDNRYTEHLEFCSAREWEGSTFEFTIAIDGDTLIQQGVESVAAAGVERYNIEKYVRVKSNP